VRRYRLPGGPLKFYRNSALALILGIPLAFASKYPGSFYVIVAAVILLALIIALIGNFSIVQYYVRIGEDGREDWHDPEAGAPPKGTKPDEKWAKTITRPPVLDGLTVEDQSPVVRELSAHIKTQVGRDKTQWQLTPNLLMPFGVALGYELTDARYVRSLTLCERMGTPLGAALARDHSCEGENNSKLEIVRPKKQYYKWCINVIADQPQKCPALELRVDLRNGPGALVIADLTINDAATVPTDILYARRYRLAAFREPGGNIDALRQTVKVGDVGDDSEGHVLCQPGPMVHQLGSMIRRAIHETEEGVVYLAIRVPKTVSVAVGYYLRNSRCSVSGCSQERCMSPWQVLVPLHYNRDQRTYSPWRASERQPEVPQIVTLMGTGIHHA